MKARSQRRLAGVPMPAERAAGSVTIRLTEAQVQALVDAHHFLADYATDFPEMRPLSDTLDSIIQDGLLL